MSVLSDILAYKQQKDAQAALDVQAIPQAVSVFQQAQQQAVKNRLAEMTLDVEGATKGLRVDTQAGTITRDPSLMSPLDQLQTKKLESDIGLNDARAKKLNNPTVDTTKQDAQDQKSWEKIVAAVDPAKASSRSTLGMASNANLRADRAMVTLNNPRMTFQDAQNVVADIAGIYAGGAPTDQGMSHSQYETVQSRISNLQQFLSGKPGDAVTPEIKQHMKEVINELKGVNIEAIKNHLAFHEKANPKVISKYQDEWNNMKASLLPQETGDAGTEQPAQTKASAIPDGTVGKWNGKTVIRQGGKWVAK